MGPLAKQALNFVRRNPRRNPPDEDEIDERVQGFCIEKKRQGENLSEWSEEEWREALVTLGVPDEELGTCLEEVASWGVDDG
jgi:hypothetical protein